MSSEVSDVCMGEGSQIFIRFWGAVGQGVVGLGTHEIIINYSFNFFFMFYIYNNYIYCVCIYVCILPMNINISRNY